MRCATLLLLLYPLPSQAQEKPKPDYFKVEIRGTLRFHEGRHELVDPQGLAFRATVLGTGLIFGDNKELAALAQKLDGKTVLIHGHLGKWSPLTAGPPSHYVTYVRVTEIKAAE